MSTTNPTDEQVLADTGKALTKFGAEHAHEVGLPSPQAVNYMFSIANMLYSSALIGKDMGLSKDQITKLREFGVPGEEIERRDQAAVKSNAMAKMLLGFEFNIEPMAALMELSIVKAKIFMPYPRLHKLIEDKGYTITELERSDTRAAIKLTHPTRPERIFEFTFEDAKKAGLTKRGGYNGESPSQYELRPRVMLWGRVISEAFRGTGGKGNVYVPEEKQEIMREEVRDALAEPETRAPEANPYAVALPEPPILKPESAAPAASEAERRRLEMITRLRQQHREATTGNRHSSHLIRKGWQIEDPVTREQRLLTDEEIYEITLGLEIPKSEKTTEIPAVASGVNAGTMAGNGVPAKPEEAVAQPGAEPAQSGAPVAGEVGATSSPSEPPKVREMPKPKIDPRVGPLMAEIEKLLPVKGRKKIVEEYLRGYFNTGDIKAVLGDPGMLTSLRFLQALATSDQWKTPLAGDPHKVGVDAAAGCAKLLAYMEGWPEDCQETAFKIALARYPDDASGLAEYLADPIQAETLGFADLRAFLWVLDRVGAKHATMFRERAANMAEAAAPWVEAPASMWANGISSVTVAIEALAEAEDSGQQNLLDMIRKGAPE